MLPQQQDKYSMAPAQDENFFQEANSYMQQNGYSQGAPVGYQPGYQPYPDGTFPPQPIPKRYSPGNRSGFSQLPPQQMQQTYFRNGRSSFDSQQSPSYHSGDANAYHNNHKHSGNPMSNSNLYPPQSHSENSQSYIRLSPSRSPRPLSPPRNKVIAIPATAAAPGSPFLRAYAQSLASHNISQGTFLTFLDRLNHVSKDSPPLQVLGVAGSLVGFMPFASAQLVSFGIGAAAKLGNVVMSKGRTEMLMSENNKQLFEPRGLRVEICKIEALARLGGIPLLDADGNVNKQSSLWSDLNDSSSASSTIDNELTILSPWVESLSVCPEISDLDTGASSTGSGASGVTANLKKFGKFAKEQKQKRDDDKFSRRRSDSEDDYRKEMEKLDRDEQAIYEKESGSRRDRELQKIQREREKVEREHQKKGGKGGNVESSFESTLWLVIKETKPTQA